MPSAALCWRMGDQGTEMLSNWPKVTQLGGSQALSLCCEVDHRSLSPSSPGNPAATGSVAGTKLVASCPHPVLCRACVVSAVGTKPNEKKQQQKKTEH